MRKNTTTTGIKGKIITGFVLLLTLIFISVYAVFKLANQLAPPDTGASTSVRKLTLTSNLLSSLIETEGMARAYLSTNDSAYLYQFYEQEAINDRYIDTLTTSSINNTKQYIRILTVDSLLDLKKQTYHNFFLLKKEATHIGLGDLHKSVNIYDDTLSITNRVISNTVTKQVPTEASRKPGFFPRLWNRITGRKIIDTTHTVNQGPVISSDTALSYQVYRNNTLNKVRSQLKKFENQRLLEQQLITEREMALLQADQKIMNEIRAVLLLFEKEEISNALSETENSRKVLNNLWITALILAGTGLLTTIGFIILIWKDLARSAFYRRQLEQARQLAESLLKVKEKFLANMSHEIRTPLTSIIGFTERLSETHLNKEQTKYLKYVNSSSEHLLELINDLLEFSRINSGKIDLVEKPFKPSALFAEAFETLEQRAKDKNLEIILDQNMPEFELLGDSLRLKQVIINLLSNSIKFTEKGKVILQTKAFLTDEGRSANIKIRVADTGIGIPKDKLEVIFEEFTQVDPGITRKYGGSGLGLAISSKLINLMNGSISVSSSIDKGTVFTIRLSLPVFRGETATVQSPEYIGEINLQGIKVLLAEDDNTTAILLADILKNFNADVVTTSNGLEAIDKYKEANGAFNLIITDIQMPGISGPEFIGQIREFCSEGNHNMPPVIGLTAHADTSDIERYKQVGMDYFVLKPFKKHEIIKVLSSVSGKLNTGSAISGNSLKGPDHSELLSTSLKSPDNNNTAENTFVNNTEFHNQESEYQSPFPAEDYPDITNFRKFTGNDEDSLRKILLSLNANIDSTVDEMRHAFESRDYAKLSLLSHRILPNMRLLEVKTTASNLKKLELMCKEEHWDEQLIANKLDESIKCLSEISIKLELLHSSPRQ